MDNLPWIALQWVIVIFIGLVGCVIVLKMLTDKIPLNSLVSEPDGKASLSRFQLLMFTFVISSIYVVICLQQGELQEISNGVLGLLGISGGSYIVSKGIQMQADKNRITSGPTPVPNNKIAGGGV
jgi:hypothetical protein